MKRLVFIGSFLLSAHCGRTSPMIYEDAVERPITNLAPTPGWSSIVDTQISPHCADPALFPHVGAAGCEPVVTAWSGAIADTRRNRLVLWGGGFTDYGGNEVYILDLDRRQMSRATDPSPSADGGPETPDGLPAGRATYDKMAYIEHADAWFVFGGVLACGSAGCASGSDTWTHDFATSTWTRRDPTGGPEPIAEVAQPVDYDPVSRRVIVVDNDNFWAYDIATNRYSVLGSSRFNREFVGVVDPEQRLMVLAGGGLRAFSLEPPFEELEWGDAPGCAALRDANYPGLAYDPVLRRVVGWFGGRSVVLLDTAAVRCDTLEQDGVDPGPALQNGTFGRFQYFPSLGVFALVNGFDTPAYVLRLAP